ncbi:P-loop NTPase fold protein [Acerihabitans sp. TG2]|uniref:KAP family P-loop NTPase fold protein n=1 Tax=Acerihabitans sp. TG2 TaxID=3096008 RepID=UPI002B2322F9|nr:P-loop NTPase fold protein [Acerihabitans sp. TG2]MEA9392651.1 P-loop NTPase fold protein [Acerihabitans sp. TG2]
MTDEQTEDGAHINAGLDASVHHPDEDRYGFTHVAEQLARAITGLGRDGSAVIGIEGAWGSGKTSLLNLLRLALEAGLDERTFVLSVSPWLDGGSVSPVESLLLPVAAIIAEEEKRVLSASALRRLKRKKTLTDTASTVLRYSQSTARRLAPVAEFAALVPGMPNTSGVLKAYSDAELLANRKTTAELRAEIADKITALDLSFIVVLDDLDRLEPAQAVEVIRLVKSVADFPRFCYILCYDKAVLAHAIQTGLGVTDGGAYLQKIVQISFSLPRPEAFSLRREFINGVTTLYHAVNGTGAEAGLLADLHCVTDLYGAALSTPREVKLALNVLKFRYGGVRDYVYLPDLCLLQLIRISNAGLYDWIEQYLTERAVVESGDGSVSEEEQTALTTSLVEHLGNFPPSTARTAFRLSSWVPGISGFRNEDIKLFSQTLDQDRAKMTTHKRLGSGAYWRYYFAFSSPQNVLPPDFFDDLFRQAADPAQQSVMAKRLLERINSNNVSSRTWFEHILSQLSPAMIATRSAAACKGLLLFFFRYGDEIIKRYQARDSWFALYDLDMYGVVDRLLRKMCEEHRETSLTLLLSLCKEDESWFWIAGYVRHLLWQNGRVGDRPVMVSDQVLSDEELDAVCLRLAERLNLDEIKLTLLNTNELLSYVYAWRDIDSPESVETWAKEIIQSDDNLLQLLIRLRSQGISSAIGRYRSLDLTSLSEFLGEPATIEQRLDRIEAGKQYPELMAEIRKALAQERF